LGGETKNTINKKQEFDRRGKLITLQIIPLKLDYSHAESVHIKHEETRTMLLKIL